MQQILGGLHTTMVHMIILASRTHISWLPPYTKQSAMCKEGYEERYNVTFTLQVLKNIQKTSYMK